MEEYKIHVYSPPTGRMLIHMLTYYSFIAPEHIYIGVKNSSVIIANMIKYLTGIDPKIGVDSSLKTHATKRLTFESDIGISIRGGHFSNLCTNDGDDILTRDGENILGELQSDDVVAHLIKYTSLEETKFAVGNSDIHSTLVNYNEINDKFAVKNSDITTNSEKFLSVESDIGVTNEVDLHAVKYASTGEAKDFAVTTEAGASITYYTKIVDSGIGITSQNISATLKRRRKLSETPKMILDMTEMTMQGLYYIEY